MIAFSLNSVFRDIPTDVFVEMAEIVLTNNYFEFGKKIFYQVSGTTIGTKFALLYVCIFMDKFETDCNYLFGLGLWMMYSSYGLMVKRNLKVS